jgi:HD-like signal output (HDOD) protein
MPFPSDSSADSPADSSAESNPPPLSEAPQPTTQFSELKTPLDHLIERMQRRGEFPALSAAVAGIQSAAGSDRQSVSELTHEVLKDVALTQKLLRLVNSVHYAHAGRGTVSTVSRAVALVGFDAVRNLALSLVLLEHMRDTKHAERMREEFLRALMAGSVASALCSLSSESEEVFIGAMFQNLGRMLASFYFPLEATEIRTLVASGKYASGEEGAAMKVLGLTFEEFGTGVARLWGLPENLQRCMHKPVGQPPVRPPDIAADRQRWIALAGNAVVEALLQGGGSHLRQVADRYARSLGQSPQEILEAVQKAREKLAVLVEVLNLQPAPGSLSSQLLFSSQAETAAPPPAEDALAPHALKASPPAASGFAPLARRNSPQVLDLLAAGVHDIATVMSEPFQVNDVVRMVLETMYRALAFQRIVFCLRDAKTETLVGRLGLGDNWMAVANVLKVPLKAPADLFAAVCLKGADTLITDTTEPRIASRLPVWYSRHVQAQAFLLLPMMARQMPFALIYADHAAPGGIVLDEKELALLRTLRNQVVAAFRQAGSHA